MTEFEQRVAKALSATQADDPSGQFYGLPDFLAVKVAPRVAAAIDAAARVVWAGESGRAIEAAALAALRGEP